MMRTQDEIVADLHQRADMLEANTQNKSLPQDGRMALKVAARALRVAAEQNSLEYTIKED